jgi:hypothetical protein
VLNARVSAAGDHMPVLRSPVNVYDGVSTALFAAATRTALRTPVLGLNESFVLLVFTVELAVSIATIGKYVAFVVVSSVGVSKEPRDPVKPVGPDVTFHTPGVEKYVQD